MAKTRPRRSGRRARARVAAAVHAARSQPGALGHAEPALGAAPRARDPGQASRHRAQHGDAAARQRRAARRGRATASTRRRTRSATGVGEGIIGKVVESSQADRRAARQPRAGVPEPRGEAPGAAEGGAELHLRADSAQPARGRRARRRPQVQARSRLRPQRQVSRHRRVEHRAGGQDPAAGRGRQEAAGRREHAAAAGAEGALRLLEHHRQQRAGAPDVRADGAGGGDQHDRAHPRRVGHRQGAGRPRHPLQLAARQQAVRQGELRGAARQPDRVGAVRLREGRLHRRRAAQEGALRAGRGRHAVPRRDRRHQPRRRR